MGVFARQRSANATALSFNFAGDSGCNPDRDRFNYWAVCNDNLNVYIEPNYFMGPTLYFWRSGHNVISDINMFFV